MNLFFRYVKSRSDRQLLDGLKYKDTSSCKPEETNNGLPIIPCGLIAWSLFNDTFTFYRERDELKVNRKNIAWKSDREHKFGKDVHPFNFQNGTLIGGAKLDPSVAVSMMRSYLWIMGFAIFFFLLCSFMLLLIFFFLAWKWGFSPDSETSIIGERKNVQTRDKVLFPQNG